MGTPHTLCGFSVVLLADNHFKNVVGTVVFVGLSVDVVLSHLSVIGNIGNTREIFVFVRNNINYHL
jgi:hypothetical protein